MPNKTPLYRNGHAWRAFISSVAGVAAGLRAAHHGIPPQEAIETGKNAALLTLGFGYGVVNKFGQSLATLPGGEAFKDRGEEVATGVAAAFTAAEMAAPHALGAPVNGGLITLGAGLGLAVRRLFSPKRKK
ncbi:MAG: hypothetical protein ACRDQZ_10610 [Mycobacteriales bacterium]